jgi:hypothetical protein
VAPTGFGQTLPPEILEFFGSANSTIDLAFLVQPVIAGHSRPKDGVVSTRLCPAIHPSSKKDGCADQARA